LGNQVVTTHQALKPHQQQEISVQSLLARAAVRPMVGSITVEQDPELKGMTVASQLLITSNRGASPAYVDEELAMPGIDGSGTLRAVADASAGTTLLAVTSIVSWTQHVRLHCLTPKSENSLATLTLAPNATLLVSNCSGQTVDSLTSFEDAVSKGSEERIESYELITHGGAGTMAAFGLAPHLRNQDVVLSGMPFSDPKKINSPNSVFAGVPFGPQPTLPDGVYAPRISLTNFSISSAHVKVSVATTQQNLPASQGAAGNSPEKRVLRQLTIDPRRTVEFALSDSTSQSGLLQSVIVESDRQPGEVLGKVVSRSDGSLYEIELLGKDQLDQNNGGIRNRRQPGRAAASTRGACSMNV
jgi:hypothetical protein